MHRAAFQLMSGRLIDLAGEFMTMICVSSETGFAETVANRVIFMD